MRWAGTRAKGGPGAGCFSLKDWSCFRLAAYFSCIVCVYQTLLAQKSIRYYLTLCFCWIICVNEVDEKQEVKMQQPICL